MFHVHWSDHDTIPGVFPQIANEITSALLKQMYFKMFLIRIFEERVLELVKEGRLWGTAHSCIGQEAVAVGVCSALRLEDYITSTHRGHGHSIAKGAHPGRMLAELMGKATGYCKGKGGSMHICDFEGGNLGANAIVGGGISIATGAALASQIEHRGRVAVSFFGDGAINTGIFHECLNLAAAWKLPVVYVCENNLYSISVATSDVIAIRNIADRALAYGMPGLTVDGNDALAVHEVTHAAVERAKAGLGPSLIECKTYRQGTHSAGVPWETRPQDEVRAWIERDPLPVMRKLLSERDPAFSTSELEQEAQNVLAAAMEFAQDSPECQPEALTEDVYA